MPSLAEAIEEKFTEVNSEINTPDEFVIIAPKVSIESGIPPVLVISSRNVEKAGDPEELSKFLASVVELDISRNAIVDLTEIGIILQHAPKLRFLNAGFNKLSASPLPASPFHFPVTDALRTLILIGTNATWDAVWFLLGHSKNVTEIHLSLNEYAKVELQNEEQYDKVDKVMFDSNPICSWEEVSKLGIAFPNLTHLSLTDCHIDAIPESGGDKLNKLKTLWLSNTRISKLEDFENLKHFAVLTDLRVNGIPFLDELSEEARRHHFIALLPTILTLNRGRTIGENDRVTAERSFIRHYLDHENPPARYHELKKIHGQVHKLVDIDFKPQTKVNLLIRYQDKELCRLDVNLKKTVKELKDYLEGIVGVAATDMDLFYLNPAGSNIETEVMKYPNKQLYTYHMKDSDEIIVYRKGTVICGSTTIRK